MLFEKESHCFGVLVNYLLSYLHNVQILRHKAGTDPCGSKDIVPAAEHFCLETGDNRHVLGHIITTCCIA